MLTAWVSGCQDQDWTVSLIYRPIIETWWLNMVAKILVITGSGRDLSPAWCKPLQPNWYIVIESSRLNCLLWSAGSEGTLTYWGLVTPYSNKILVTIGSGNDLLPVRCQAIACRVESIQFQNLNCSSIQIPELIEIDDLKMELEIWEL